MFVALSKRREKSARATDPNHRAKSAAPYLADFIGYNSQKKLHERTRGRPSRQTAEFRQYSEEHLHLSLQSTEERIATTIQQHLDAQSTLVTTVIQGQLQYIFQESQSQTHNQLAAEVSAIEIRMNNSIHSSIQQFENTIRNEIQGAQHSTVNTALALVEDRLQNVVADVHSRGESQLESRLAEVTARVDVVAHEMEERIGQLLEKKINHLLAQDQTRTRELVEAQIHTLAVGVGERIAQVDILAAGVDARIEMALADVHLTPTSDSIVNQLASRIDDTLQGALKELDQSIDKRIQRRLDQQVHVFNDAALDIVQQNNERLESMIQSHDDSIDHRIHSVFIKQSQKMRESHSHLVSSINERLMLNNAEIDNRIQTALESHPSSKRTQQQMKISELRDEGRTSQIHQKRKYRFRAGKVDRAIAAARAALAHRVEKRIHELRKGTAYELCIKQTILNLKQFTAQLHHYNLTLGTRVVKSHLRQQHHLRNRPKHLTGYD